MWWQTFLTFAISGFGLWALFKYVILIEMRIDANTFKTLYDLCKDDKKFICQEEFISETRYPCVYVAFCFYKSAPWFFINHGERLMQTGWHGKEAVTTVTCFRWRYGKVKLYLSKKLKEMQIQHGVPVELMTPDYTDKIGTLKDELQTPLIDESIWKDFDNEIAEVVAGTRKKTSALFYGPPGNGKTSLVKYLAIKHHLPIKIITFNPDWSNHHLLLLFAQIPPRCIVLLEDFDNYFHGRKCIIGGENKSIKFTFDIILNGLDGVYTTYEQVVFIMTVNDIDKVDYALRNRPSRFKYTRQFPNPNLTVRKKLLKDKWAEMSDGLNLDQIFRLKEYHDQGNDFTTAMKRLEKEVPDQELQKIAYQRFEDRLQTGLSGNHEEDWFHAVHSVNGMGK